MKKKIQSKRNYVVVINYNIDICLYSPTTQEDIADIHFPTVTDRVRLLYVTLSSYVYLVEESNIVLLAVPSWT